MRAGSEVLAWLPPPSLSLRPGADGDGQACRVGAGAAVGRDHETHSELLAVRASTVSDLGLDRLAGDIEGAGGARRRHLRSPVQRYCGECSASLGRARSQRRRARQRGRRPE